MAEILDVLDANGNRTGRTMVRGEPIRPGDYHLVVHIWIRNEKGEYLIQKRADHLEWKPGIWATTGGSVVAGEDSQAGAIRETREEVGLELEPDRMQYLTRRIGTNRIWDIWLADVVSDRSQVDLGPEVADARWVTKAELLAMVAAGRFFNYRYLDVLPE